MMKEVCCASFVLLKRKIGKILLSCRIFPYFFFLEVRIFASEEMN